MKTNNASFDPKQPLINFIRITPQKLNNHFSLLFFWLYQLFDKQVNSGRRIGEILPVPLMQRAK